MTVALDNFHTPAIRSFNLSKLLQTLSLSRGLGHAPMSSRFSNVWSFMTHHAHVLCLSISWHGKMANDSVLTSAYDNSTQRTFNLSFSCSSLCHPFGVESDRKSRPSLPAAPLSCRTPQGSVWWWTDGVLYLFLEADNPEDIRDLTHWKKQKRIA